MTEVGKQYDGGSVVLQADEMKAYADATDDPNPAYRGADVVAPPMFHVQPFIRLMLDLAGDPELKINMLRLVHGEHTMSFSRLLRPGERLVRSATLLGVEPKSSGTVYSFGLHGDVGEERVLDGVTRYFVRAENPPKRTGPKKAPPALPPPSWTKAQPVSEDQADRYAAASHDRNPIHVDENVAKKAGLPGVILHGLCTLAFAARDLVEQHGDPSALKELGVRFAAPVFPGETLRLEVWEGEGRSEFRTLNAKGKPVLTGGYAVFE